MSFSCLHGHNAKVPTRPSICLFRSGGKRNTQVWSEHQMLYSSPVLDVSTHLTLRVMCPLTTKQPPGRPTPLLLLLLCCPLCPLCELGLLPPCHHQTLGSGGIGKCWMDWGLAPKKDKICWWHCTLTWIKPTKAILIQWKNQVQCLWEAGRKSSKPWSGGYLKRERERVYVQNT